MRYDRDGFPIPPVFDGEPLRRSAGEPPLPAAPVRGRRASKRIVLVGAAAALLGAIVLPEAMPLVRQAMVGWALERAAACEARNDIGGAVAALGRALRWHGADAELLCLRAMLRLEDRDTAGAVDDASAAAAAAPLSPQP